MTPRKSVVGLVLGFAVGLCAVVFVVMSDRGIRQKRERVLVPEDFVEPVGFIEKLKGGDEASLSVRSATFQVAKGGTWVNSLSLGKEEANALLKIIREAAKVELAVGACDVYLPPMVDRLTVAVDEVGRKVSYECDLSSDRGLVWDRSTNQTYVVPKEHVVELEGLLAGKKAPVAPRREQ
jgi:hypothetical protein